MIGVTILFTIASVILLFGIIITIYTNVVEWLLIVIISAVLSVCGIVTLESIPRNTHVREGKAHYVEQNHIDIINGDTINTYKTYQIEWNQNTK